MTKETLAQANAISDEMKMMKGALNIIESALLPSFENYFKTCASKEILKDTKKYLADRIRERYNNLEKGLESL